MSSLIVKIGKIWNSAEGTTQKIDLDLQLGPHYLDFQTTTSLTGDLLLIKLKDEVSVLLSNANVSVTMNCSFCLKPFDQPINIESAERQFLGYKPSKIEDPADLFLIDLNKVTIDLTEMLRQEIILHFPLIPVCSESCKGLCQICGKDRNKAVCNCKVEDAKENKPFKNLKTILKKSALKSKSQNL